MPKRVYQWALYALMLAFVVGCGGTTNPGDSGQGDGGGTNNPSPDDNNPSTPPPGGSDGPVVRLGSYDNAGNFVVSVIDASSTSVISGQQATLSVDLINENGTTVTEPVDIFFTSVCASSGLAVVEPASVTTSTGHAGVTYTARGCDGPDEVTAHAAVDGATLTAAVTLTTHAAPPASILFINADPPQLGIQGTGGVLPEQSDVTFKVTNANGGPAPNKLVQFTLNTQVGGVKLSHTQAFTGRDGLVSTTVSSGTVPTSVRVTASTTNNAGEVLTVVSNALAITTGIPDNDSISLSAESLNIEGWAYDGVTTELTALLADRFNNPVPDGTSVIFNAEGGSVEGTCQTIDGQCSVIFRSQSPRPADGRVTIRATANGEESFTDSNGNGRYDSGETFGDLPEAFRDDNENGTRQSNEPFIDFNNDQSYTPASGSFTGVLCTGGCDIATTVSVRDSIVITLSGSSLKVSTSPSPINLNNGLQSVTVTVEDDRGQVAPAGTTVAVEATQGELVGSATYTQSNTNASVTSGAGRFKFYLKPGTAPGTGQFIVTVTTPKGTISRDLVTITQN